MVLVGRFAALAHASRENRLFRMPSAAARMREPRFECAAGLNAADRVQRPDGLGGLEISVTPRGEVTRELAERFAQAGVDRLVVLIQPGDGGPERAIESGAAAVAGL